MGELSNADNARDPFRHFSCGEKRRHEHARAANRLHRHNPGLPEGERKGTRERMCATLNTESKFRKSHPRLPLMNRNSDFLLLRKRCSSCTERIAKSVQHRRFSFLQSKHFIHACDCRAVNGCKKTAGSDSRTCCPFPQHHFGHEKSPLRIHFLPLYACTQIIHREVRRHPLPQGKSEHDENDREEEVHENPCEEDQEPGGYGCRGKAPLSGAVLRLHARFPLQTDKSSERNPIEREERAFPRKEILCFGRKSETEFLHRHFRPLRDHKVSQFMDKHQEREKDEECQCRKCDRHTALR